MSKQTAVDWLIDQIVNHNGVNSKTFEQAKAMEREQILTAYGSDRYPCSDEDAQQYYNETFKGGQP